MKRGGIRPNSGRKGHGLEKAFWDKLNKALPEAVDYCIEIIKDVRGSTARADREMGLKAASILMSRAPQRVEGAGDNGEIVFKVFDFRNED